MPIHDAFNLMLAQESTGIPMPTDAVSGAPGGPAGAPGANGARPAPSPMGNQFFLVILLGLGALIVFSMLGQRRDRKKQQAMLSALKKHDKVQTIGGVIGSVVEVKPDLVVLKVDESSNTRITITRTAIQQVLSPVASDAGAKEDPS